MVEVGRALWRSSSRTGCPGPCPDSLSISPSWEALQPVTFTVKHYLLVCQGNLLCFSLCLWHQILSPLKRAWIHPFAWNGCTLMSLLQTEQYQHSWPLLTGEMLQSLCQVRGSSVHSPCVCASPAGHSPAAVASPRCREGQDPPGTVAVQPRCPAGSTRGLCLANCSWAHPGAWACPSPGAAFALPAEFCQACKGSARGELGEG